MRPPFAAVRCRRFRHAPGARPLPAAAVSAAPIACAALVALLAGCPVTPDAAGPADPWSGEGIEERSDLFVEDPPGTTVLQTNDSALWGPYGTTLWALRGGGQTPFVSREATASKVSGDGSAGFGLVFCHYDTGDPLLGETMLVVMINTRQEFIVGEVVGTSFRELIPWTTTTALRLGHGQGNVLRVEQAGGEFRLLANGVEVATFRDDDPPTQAGGADGYLVVISPLDDFPAVPVHVVFEES